MKKVHGKVLQDVTLMNTVLMSKKLVSKRHYLLTIGFPYESTIEFEPGDHIKIFPENDSQLVQEIMKRLSEAPGENDIVVWNGENVFFS